MGGTAHVSMESLTLDPVTEVARICRRMRELLRDQLKRRGVVVGLSGGVDSSVTAALAVAALGRSRVMGVEMPERDSAPESLELSGMLARRLGIETVREDISGMLEAVGFYAKYREA